MMTRYRVRAAVPARRIEEFFVWLEKNCSWADYGDDQTTVHFTIPMMEFYVLAEQWPEATFEKTPTE